MQIDAEMGQRIKQTRTKAGLTQKQLAEKCGLATGTIQQYELGKRYPKSKEIVEKIAVALNTSSLYILWGQLNPEKIVDASRQNLSRKILMNQAENNLLSIFHKLNDNGKAKVVAYSMDIYNNPEYRADTRPPAVESPDTSDQDE